MDDFTDPGTGWTDGLLGWENELARLAVVAVLCLRGALC